MNEGRGCFLYLRRLFQFSPEAKAELELRKTFVASSAYYGEIRTAVNKEDQYVHFDDTIREELVARLTQTWLDNHGRDVFPNMDEFEVDGKVYQTPDHDERGQHQRFTLRQLGEWIDIQRRQLDIE